MLSVKNLHILTKKYPLFVVFLYLLLLIIIFLFLFLIYARKDSQETYSHNSLELLYSQMGFESSLEPSDTFVVRTLYTNNPTGSYGWLYNGKILGAVRVDDYNTNPLVVSLEINRDLPEEISTNNVKNYLLYRAIFSVGTNQSSAGGTLDTDDNFSLHYKKVLKQQTLFYK